MAWKSTCSLHRPRWITSEAHVIKRVPHFGQWKPKWNTNGHNWQHWRWQNSSHKEQLLPENISEKEIYTVNWRKYRKKHGTKCQQVLSKVCSHAEISCQDATVGDAALPTMGPRTSPDPWQLLDQEAKSRSWIRIPGTENLSDRVFWNLSVCFLDLKCWCSRTWVLVFWDMSVGFLELECWCSGTWDLGYRPWKWVGLNTGLGKWVFELGVLLRLTSVALRVREQWVLVHESCNVLNHRSWNMDLGSEILSKIRVLDRVLENMCHWWWALEHASRVLCHESSLVSPGTWVLVTNSRV